MNTGSSQFQAPSAVAVVNALLMRALAQGDGGLASPKAQDLLYLAHGWQLATEGRPLVSGGFLADADGTYQPRGACSWLPRHPAPAAAPAYPAAASRHRRVG